jgi:hypothetical protein
MAESTNVAAEPETELVSPDLVLLLLAAPGRHDADSGRVNGITRLEKLLFLANMETEAAKGVKHPFQFKAYDYGPYSKAVYEAMDILEQAGLVAEDRSYSGQSQDEMEDWVTSLDEREGVERRFWLTPAGRGVADLLATSHSSVAAAIAAIKRQYGSLSLRQLIRYVYTAYPDYAKASKILDTAFS